MLCTKCNSDHIQAVSNTTGSIKPRGIISSASYMALGICTLGLLSSGSKGTIQTQIQFACLDCGNVFNPPQPFVEKFYHTSIFMWACLVVFTPFGIAVMWAMGRYTRLTRIAISIMSLLWFALIHSNPHR